MKRGMTFVTVYRFRVWENDLGRFVAHQRMGRRAAIATLQGQMVEGSATEVLVSEIDEEGLTIRDFAT
jgi:hypothetical protein